MAALASGTTTKPKENGAMVTGPWGTEVGGRLGKSSSASSSVTPFNAENLKSKPLGTYSYEHQTRFQ